MHMDENSLNNGYQIRSLYFDDVNNSALFEKTSGISERKKFRVRIYNNDDSKIKLEIKKKYQEFTNKKSTFISKKEYENIYNCQITDLMNSNNDIRREYYFEIRNRLLKPKIIIDYYREAYTLPYNEIRVTFDNDLSYSKPDLNIFSDKTVSYQLAKEYSRILEIKYNNFLPDFVKRIFEPFSLTKLSVSKYVLCREKLNRL